MPAMPGITCSASTCCECGAGCSFYEQYSVVKLEHIEYIVFDVGGVLVELAGASTLFEWTGDRFGSEAELYEAWICCPAVQEFERGHCSVDKFSKAVVNELGLPVTPADFLEEFVRWPNGLLEGAASLLDQLKEFHKVACLSNTNELHWMNQKDASYLNTVFDQMFLSYRMGMVKPDLEIYDSMIELIRVPPHKVLFLDDNQINVDAAKQSGLRAYRVRGVGETRAVLRSLASGET
jgi:HAD superfamily hydrolase (TIGR01509 family)